MVEGRDRIEDLRKVGRGWGLGGELVQTLGGTQQESNMNIIVV